MITDPRGNVVRQRYYEKETIVKGDEENIPETFRRWWNHANAKIYRLFAGRIIGNVLDIGCNIGMVSLLIAKDPAVSYVLGLDVNLEAVMAAGRYANYLGDAKCVFQVADFTLPTLFEEAFDSAVTFHTLEHIYPRDLPQFMTNLHQVLKPNGVVLVSIPYMANYWDKGHKCIFDWAKLETLFEDYGFEAEFGAYRYDTMPEYDDKILTGLFVKEE